MIIYIFSTQYDIGQIINDHLCDKGHLCFLFETTDTLALSLKNLKKYPDLLILDYTSFNHDIFNLFKYFKELKIYLPTIFYNDPCITKTTRAKHWESQVQLLQENCIIQNIEDYKKTFEQLSELIESKELSPYIKLMQEPLPLPDNLKKSQLTLENIKSSQNDTIGIFKNKVNLPKNLFYLLSKLQENKGLHMTAKDIVKIYEQDGKKITESSLKVQLSKLRSEIEKDPECKFIISNNRGLYSFIRFRTN